MKDDFWDIDKLLPPRPVHRRCSPSKSIGEICEITDGNTADKSIPIRDFAGIESAPKNVCEFDFSSQSTILQKAIISDWQGSYSYNNDFYANAHHVHGVSAPQSAEYVPFFSYMPQYSDLTSYQYAYYLKWRSGVRNGEYLKTDTSYIFLYIYEILALDDVIPAEASIKILIELWSAYHTEHPELNRHLCEWIVDYAVIHNILIPFDTLSTFLSEIHVKQHSILFNIYLFDYLFTSEDKLTLDNIITVCNILGNYSPFGNKYYSEPEYKKAFDRCIVDIFKNLFRLGFFSLQNFNVYQQEVKMSRPSYISAVCSSKTKKNITVIYYPYVTNELLRITFSNIIKHIENKIRIHLGYKSRLSSIALNDELRKAIDEYMNMAYPAPTKAQRTASSAPKPAVQKIKKVEVDLAKAKQIEDISWQTTEKLTEGLDIIEDEPQEIPEVQPTPPENDSSLPSLLSPLEKEVIKMLINSISREQIHSFILEKGFLPDAVADSINEKALDIIGDTIIDTSDFTIIEDYIDELSSF